MDRPGYRGLSPEEKKIKIGRSTVTKIKNQVVEEAGELVS